MKRKIDLMERRRKLRGGVAERLNVPPNALGGSAQIEIVSNREATVEGCRGVIEYSSSEITLDLGDSVASFTGSSLCMKYMTRTSAVIEGEINSVTFK